MSILQISRLQKDYGREPNIVHALTDITFSVEGGVFGLLGHNGAGKTTLMKLISTISKPTSGSISVCGFDTRAQGDDVRKLIGYLPQELNMYPSLSVADFVGYMAELKGVRSKKKVMDVLEQVDMAQFAKRRISQLSGGMKRRVGIASALVGDPQILIVDEPTAGLDPEERVRFRGVLSRFAKDGKCVLLSTHIVEDVYQLCEQLAVLRKGTLFFCGSAEDLLSHVAGKIKIIALENENELISLQKKTVVISTTYEHNKIQARIMDENNHFSAPAVTETLEDAYVYYMGGNRMSKLLAVTKYEYKMQIKRIAGWIVLLFVVVSAMMDCLPTTSNLARVEFLGDIRYYVRRVFSFDGLILLFGVLFLTAGRLVDDRKSGRRELFMAAPIGKASYIAGKLAGNFLFALTLMYSLLIVSLCGFAIFSPANPPLSDYMGAVFSVSVCIILPATFFVAASGVMLPEIVDIRLVYLLYSVLFLVNAFSSDTAEARPFYIFTQGDLAKMIWQHPKFQEVYIGSACLNLLFMLGIGILAIILVAGKRRFWRAE